MIERCEYLTRIEKFARLLREKGLHGAVLTAETNFTYFSGFRSHAPWTTLARTTFLMISADGRSAILTSAFAEPEVRRMSVVDDIRTYSQTIGVAVDKIVDILSDLGMRGGPIGMELGNEQRLDVCQIDFQRIVEGVKPDPIVDASDLIWKLRMIKSPAEVALLKKAADITADALRACFEAARPGMTELELGHIAATTMVQQGAERPGFIVVTSGEGNYAIMSQKPTGRRLQTGDLLWMDMGAVYDGYWSDFCRTAYLGKRQPNVDSDHALIVDVNAAAIDKIKIGAPVRDAAAAAVEAFKKHGVEIKLAQSRIGHGIGLLSAEPPSLALFEDTVCEEGLVFTVEPRFVRPHGLFNCEEIIVVTKAGAELLTTMSRDVTYIN